MNTIRNAEYQELKYPSYVYLTINNVNSRLDNNMTEVLDTSRINLNFNHGKGETWETDATYCYVSSFLSIAVFLTGIILARFGLWISDLTVTQALQV